jgi:hypothetical protein
MQRGLAFLEGPGVSRITEKAFAQGIKKVESAGCGKRFPLILRRLKTF